MIYLSRKLPREFYAEDAREVAEKLLGKVLVHEVDGVKIKGKIVETEAYIGAIDKASHAYGGRRTPRTEPLYGNPGIAYVYFIYGMYYCFNAITKEKEIPEGVLIRALEPLEGLEKMSKLRFKKTYNELTKAQIRNLTSGPSKLCMALNITKDQNMKDLCGKDIYIEEDNSLDNFEIVKSNRIGIDYAEEARDFKWRFYIKDNPWVSVK